VRGTGDEATDDMLSGSPVAGPLLGLGPCVVIHVDQMPQRSDRGSFLLRARGALRQSFNVGPPPWEEHMGVVDHRTAERIATEHGAQLEILGNC